MKKRAIFLDRDGVINRDRADYVTSWNKFEFLPGVLDALYLLSQMPFLIVVVTNQSAIGRGLVSQAMVEKIHQRMRIAIEQAGGRIDAVYYCPHLPEANCNCRKPKPGMLLRAAVDLDIDLSQSWLIGDSLRDIQASVAVGVQPILVRTGHRIRDTEIAVPILDNLLTVVKCVNFDSCLNSPSSTLVREKVAKINT